MTHGIAHWRGNHRRAVWEAMVYEMATVDMIAIKDQADRATVARAALEYVNNWPSSSAATSQVKAAWDRRGMSWRAKRRRGAKWMRW